MSAPVDVLAVLQNEIDHAGCLGPRASEARARRLESVRAAVVELIEAAAALRARLYLYGDWEDGCFYYNGYSAPELMAPMADVDAALARVKGGAA